MQYGVIPTSIAERVALMAGAVPVPMIDLLFGIMKARIIMAGVNLGVFDALARESQTTRSLAATLELDESCLDMLLRTMVYAGYLRLSGRRYSLSALGRNTMVTGAPRELTGFTLWHYSQWKFVEHLETLVRTGQGVDFHTTLEDPVAWGHYQKAMLEAARFDAPVIARHVPVRRGSTRLLDLAGSHGLLGAAICRKHPPMRSTVVELPAAMEHARDLARHEGHADIVEHHAGDLLRDDLGKGWDVILLSNILHHLDPEQARDVIARSHEALASDGTVAIWELERPAPGATPGQGDGVALFFRLTSSAAAYSGDQYVEWLAAGGFGHCRIIRPRLRPGTVLVHARRA
jgi:hypothetical protein